MPFSLHIVVYQMGRYRQRYRNNNLVIAVIHKAYLNLLNVGLQFSLKSKVR